MLISNSLRSRLKDETLILPWTSTTFPLSCKPLIGRAGPNPSYVHLISSVESLGGRGGCYVTSDALRPRRSIAFLLGRALCPPPAPAWSTGIGLRGASKNALFLKFSEPFVTAELHSVHFSTLRFSETSDPMMVFVFQKPANYRFGLTARSISSLGN
ncbi:hypothetical protein GWI33_015744 [Rhynchophorus ferrugineus]|uniref:Uncharacterized protein n=1 Tax=Rhynchophorus ferrugineus TaxID=354439 RepID=A0A834I083_RHYFE|nr:hypothetical protein GWI33_015744 [Rhynchophorus ferrugineus]